MIDAPRALGWPPDAVPQSSGRQASWAAYDGRMARAEDEKSRGWPLGPSTHEYTADELRGDVPNAPLRVVEAMAPTSDPYSVRLYLSRPLTPMEESQFWCGLKKAGLMAEVKA